jgi:hypothetical protein
MKKLEEKYQQVVQKKIESSELDSFKLFGFEEEKNDNDLSSEDHEEEKPAAKRQRRK